jgi:hypothetical protein
MVADVRAAFDLLSKRREVDAQRVGVVGHCWGGRVAWLAAWQLVDFLVPSAQAQQAEIDINTPQINAIKARMAARQRQTLDPLFDAGAIGFTSNGLVSIRDRSAVPLSERRNLESAVADENRDRQAVYREIAVANGL